jgi:leucyl aminopeptidase (aminopeptidase T)
LSELRESVASSLDRLEVRQGEEVAILVDADTEQEVWQEFFRAASARAADPTVVLMPTRGANGLEPTGAAARSVVGADVVFALTTASATHTKALKAAAANGARVCSMPGVTLDIMTAQVMTPNYEEMQELGARLAEVLAPGREMRVTTARGTDLRVGLGGWDRMPMVDDGTFAPGLIANLPAGEVLIVPWEGDSDGDLVVDLAVSCYPKPLEEPVKMRFGRGNVTSVEGGEPAARIRRLIEENGATSSNFAEMAIGINRHARNTGVLIETEKQFGSAHLGIGNSANLGGNVWAPIHIDVIFGAPTISVDGRTILREGVFTDVVLRRESYRDFEPLSGTVRLADGKTRVEGGKLLREWADIHGTGRISQVGDDETAGLAVAVRGKLAGGEDLSSRDRQVAAVMRLYGAAS